MNYYILEGRDEGRCAGSKARDDVSEIMSSIPGWAPLCVRRLWGTGGGLKKVQDVFRVIADWKTVESAVLEGDVLLVQYPISVGPKISNAALPFIRKIKAKGVAIILLIHDIDSLRGMVVPSEAEFLSLADVMIVHNEMMESWVKERYPASTVRLGIFDYLYEGDASLSAEGVDVAGNLDHRKSGFVYEVLEAGNPLKLNLYGPNFDSSVVGGEAYLGQFDPEDLPSKLTGKYGLVWDGPTAQTCAGEYGEYLRYNNPHKLSLYISIGKPVIIWNEAAESSFVEEHGLGLSVSSLREAADLCPRISEDKYEALRKNAIEMSKLLRGGYYTRRAIDEALHLLGRDG